MSGLESLDWMRDALKTALMLSAPVLFAGALVGLVVGLFQSVMQLHDQTLNFVPKFLAILTMLVVVIPWMMQVLAAYASQMFSQGHAY